MKIIMLQTRYGSEDGFAVLRFMMHEQYEIADSLGVYFILLGVANPVTAQSSSAGYTSLINRS